MMYRGFNVPARVGELFPVTSEAVDLISFGVPAARLGLTRQGKDVAAPWISPGYRTGIVGDGWAAPLFVLRAAAEGHSVTVITESVAVWSALVARCGFQALVDVRDDGEGARADAVTSSVLVLDTPRTSMADALQPPEGAALVVVRGRADASDVAFLQACHLVVVTPHALPAEIASVAGALAGPQHAGRSLEADGVLVRADGQVLDVCLALSEAEGQALGVGV